jgi:hypothetical protein
MTAELVILDPTFSDQPTNESRPSAETLSNLLHV